MLSCTHLRPVQSVARSMRSAAYACVRPMSTVASATPAAAASPAFEPTVVFPPSKAYLARVAAQHAKANPPPPAPKVVRREPRHFALRTSTKVHAAKPPQRAADGAVPWTIARRTNGQLPVTLDRARMENSKHYLTISQIGGDVKSLVAEIQLFVGPFYTVKANTVDTAIEVRSTPKSKCTPAFLDSFKQWLIKIGV